MGSANAGSTGTANLLKIAGSGYNPGYDEDYVSWNIDTYHSYFIEVPPSMSSLQIDLFDADVVLSGGTRDSLVGGRNTGVRYTVIDPSGTTQNTTTLATNSCGSLGSCDGAWVNLYTKASPAAGHWELRVNQSSAITTGDDTNALGIRAHDGTSGAGGTEYNVYAPSFFWMGATTADITYTVYPWVHSGCRMDANDWDAEPASYVGQSWNFWDRTAAFTQTIGNGSLHEDWGTNSITGWTTTQTAAGYGIWRSTFYIDTTSGVNVIGIYLGRYSYNTPASPPPTTQPQARTARIYFPNDNGTAPSEPYMEQRAAHVSGASTYTVGQVTRVAITVIVVNPTAQSISFSGTFGGNNREVRATVPAVTGVTYADNSQVSQGTIAQEPSVGGTGLIRWDVGTVAAGATATMTYQIDVTPPNGSSFLITGSEGVQADATRALYNDQTGNTTQAAANPELGSLCGLTAQASVAVFASIGNFRSEDSNHTRILSWDTNNELGAMEFSVERRLESESVFTPIRNARVPALLSAVQGGHYRVIDEATRESAEYRIIERDARDQRSVHGPFRALPRAGASLDRSLLNNRFERTPHALRAALVDTPPPAFPSVRPLDATPLNAVHLTIGARGMYRMDAASLADAFGDADTEMSAALAAHDFVLTRNDEPVAWTSSRDGQALLFFGEPIDSIFARDTVYRLARGHGVEMERVSPAAGPSASSSFVAHAHVEEELFPALAVNPDPDSDYWFWKVISSAVPDKLSATFELTLPGAVTSAQDASLRVGVYGITDNAHHVRVVVNGSDAGELSFVGRGPLASTLTIPANLVRPGTNTVELAALAHTGIDSNLYIDAFDIDYARSYDAGNAPLLVEQVSAGDVHVDNVGGDDVLVLDIDDENRPRLLDGVTLEMEDGSMSAGFPAEAGSYFVTRESAMLTPVRVWADRDSSLRAATNEADYLVITPGELRDEAVRLANSRALRGLLTQVVTLDDIYDEFSHGQPNPHAIHDFLAHASSHWTRAPRYVALAGAGTFDYRDVMGRGGNLVPPLMRRTSRGMFPADAAFMDFDAADEQGIVIGRLPAQNAAEMRVMVDKILDYEAEAPGDWNARALVVADDNMGADFTSLAQTLASQLSSRFAVESIHLSEVPIPDARTELHAALNAGLFAMSYNGHGAADRFNSDGVLTYDDALALTNGTRLPLVAAGSCLAAGFGMPGVPGVGEGMLRAPSGGAIAVWAPSAIADAVNAELVASTVLRGWSRQSELPLGDIVRASRAFLHARDVPNEELLTFTLLGDPALLPNAGEPPPVVGRPDGGATNDEDAGTIDATTVEASSAPNSCACSAPGATHGSARGLAFMVVCLGASMAWRARRWRR